MGRGVESGVPGRGALARAWGCEWLLFQTGVVREILTTHYSSEVMSSLCKLSAGSRVASYDRRAVAPALGAGEGGQGKHRGAGRAAAVLERGHSWRRGPGRGGAGLGAQKAGAWRRRPRAGLQVRGAGARPARSLPASLAVCRAGPTPRVGFQWLGWPERSGPPRCKTRL